MLTQADFYNSVLSMADSLSELNATVKRLEEDVRELKEIQKFMNAPSKPETVEETVIESNGEVKKATRKKKVTLNEEVKA